MDTGQISDQQQSPKQADNKVTPYLESVSESTMACLVTMVQGNIFALGLGHLVIASQTGIIAGIVASTALLLAKTKNRVVISIVLGIATGVVDFFTHEGAFGAEATEAIVTGFGAAVLSYAIGNLMEYYRAKKEANAASSA